MNPYRVLGICGSLRAESYNAALLRAAIAAAPEGMEIEAYDELRDLPHYDGDLDAPEHRPAPAAALRRRVEEADGVLLVTPEYNCSMPGVLKNALDWLGTEGGPGERMPLTGKPVAITGASPGAFGAVRAQHAIRAVLFSTGSDVVTRPELAVHNCHQRFDGEGRLVDEMTVSLLGGLLRSLADRIDRQRADENELMTIAGASAEAERKAS